MKNKALITIYFIFLAGIVGGCAKEQTDLFPTPTMIPTNTITDFPEPTKAPGGFLAIDEVHFSSPAFRDYIAKNYDTKVYRPLYDDEARQTDW